jgi:hypothetical protein
LADDEKKSEAEVIAELVKQKYEQIFGNPSKTL